MAPEDNLVNGPARCLAAPGAEYAVYVPAGQDSVTLDLSALVGPATLSFYNPRTGVVDFTASSEGGGSRTIAMPGGSQDWALLVTSKRTGKQLPGLPATPDPNSTRTP